MTFKKITKKEKRRKEGGEKIGEKSYGKMSITK